MEMGKPIHKWQLRFEGDWPTSVAFVGDDSTVVAGNRSGHILMWRLPDNPAVAPPEQAKNSNSSEKTPPGCNPIRKFNGHTNSITHLRSLPNQNSFVSSSLDHSIRLWDLDSKSSGSELVVLDDNERKKRAARVRKSDRDQILNAPGVKVNTFDAQHVFDTHKGWVYGLDIDQSGNQMISGDDQCLSIVWDLKKRESISSWTGHDRVWVRSAAISPDGKTAFTCEYAGRRSSFDVPAAQARLWDVESGKMKLDLLRAWTPKVKDKDRGDTYGYLQVWSKLMKRGFVCADFSPDGKVLALGQGGETDTGKIHLVAVDSGKILRTVSGHRYGVCDVKFSADGKYVFSSGRDTTVRICQVTDGKEIASLGKSRGGQFKDWIHAIDISPNQKLVAGADIAGYIHIWEI